MLHNTSDHFTVSLNGMPCPTAAPYLRTLLEEQGYDLKAAFACARNQVFVPRPAWATTQLHQGDRIDVVAPVTGG